MKILVAGGRDNWDHEGVARELGKFPKDELLIITGGAPGADCAALRWAMSNGVKFKNYPADWVKHGKAGGPIRNRLMLTDGKPDLVIAFRGWNGTFDMCSQAIAAGIDIHYADGIDSVKRKVRK